MLSRSFSNIFGSNSSFLIQFRPEKARMRKCQSRFRHFLFKFVVVNQYQHLFIQFRFKFVFLNFSFVLGRVQCDIIKVDLVIFNSNWSLQWSTNTEYLFIQFRRISIKFAVY